ncbi:hypothetical protein OIU79_010165 [Salix purpurea]|uniref:Uncharacterized protein n=1 Tax=Salix purpurea TaxID=77065 RepID=A0A9Q0T8N1_SALPP|nr:hypothetical protein OIU79_010165 [Salix purpurea]
MMYHVPPSIMELKDISYVKWPIVHLLNIHFHGNPCHASQHTSPYITNLEVQSLLPVECKLPTL